MSQYEPKQIWNGQEYGLGKEDDFRSTLHFYPDTINIFHPSSRYRTDKDSKQSFGWFSSYGGTLVLPKESQNILICTDGLTWKEVSYLMDNFRQFGEFYSYGKNLKWSYKNEDDRKENR